MKTSRGVIPLLAAVLGLILVAVSFVLGVSAALTGSGGGAGPFEVLFIGGLALGLAALVLSIVRLVRGAPRALPIATIVVALLPAIGIVALILANTR